MPAPRIDLELRPSRLYGCGLLALHSVTCLLLLSAPLPAGVLVPLLLLTLLLSLRAWRHWRGLARWQLLRIQDGEMRLVERPAAPDAVAEAARLLTSWLVILPLRCAAGPGLMPLLPDAMSGEDWRRLQVWLRRGSAAGDKKH